MIMMDLNLKALNNEFHDLTAELDNELLNDLNRSLIDRNFWYDQIINDKELVGKDNEIMELNYLMDCYNDRLMELYKEKLEKLIDGQLMAEQQVVNRLRKIRQKCNKWGLTVENKNVSS